MIRRLLHSTAVMGLGGFALFWWLLENGTDVDAARNLLLLLLFVLFENFQTFNSRSEHHSIFRRGFLSNRFPILGVVGAQALHIAAMHMPGLGATLNVAPCRPRNGHCWCSPPRRCSSSWKSRNGGTSATAERTGSLFGIRRRMPACPGRLPAREAKGSRRTRRWTPIRGQCQGSAGVRLHMLRGKPYSGSPRLGSPY